LAKDIAEDPLGDLADRVFRLCDAHPRYGTSPLWRAWIARRRALAAPRRAPTMTLAELRRLRGMSQTKLASRIGMTQSDLSKAERRADWKLSTLEAIARGLGLRATVVFEDEHGRPAGVVASDSRTR
jgi:DNA-binding Xre family transcriptional regulator